MSHLLYIPAFLLLHFLSSNLCLGKPTLSPAVSSLDSLLNLNTSSPAQDNEDYEEDVNIPEKLLALEDAAAGSASENSTFPRGKRQGLPTDQETGKVLLLFQNKQKGQHESYTDLEVYPPKRSSAPPGAANLSSIDFIIRLQEKYHYETCVNYLGSVHNELTKTYFEMDHDLVQVANINDTDFIGNAAWREARKEQVNKTFNSRYRLYGEPCDVEQEWYFWRDMFLAAENDTFLIVFKDSSSRATIRRQMKNIMHDWNKVWNNYRTRGVCNQKLLLECISDDPDPKVTTGYCQCRTQGVGLNAFSYSKPVRDGVLPDVPSRQTVQYYEDVVKNVHGTVKHFWGHYVHRQRCVVTATFPYIAQEIPMINPCDFSLPMIGICKAECVNNATCVWVHQAEKEKIKNQLVKTPIYERIFVQKRHNAYHHRCVCNPGKRCTKVNKDTIYGQTVTLSQLGTGTMVWLNVAVWGILQQGFNVVR